MGNTALGILIMLASTSVMNLGLVIEKKAVDGMPPLERQAVGKSVKNLFSSKLWLFGYVLTLAAFGLNMVAIGQADISVIQPLGGFGMVVLAVFSYQYLKETLNRRMIAGIGACITGVVLIGITALPGRSLASLDEIVASYVHPGAIALLVILIATIAVLSLVAYRIESHGWTNRPQAIDRRPRSHEAGIIFAFVAACSAVVGLASAKGIFAYIDIAGFAAALSAWQAYVLLVLLIVFSTLTIAFQQLSFQKGKAVVVTTVSNVSSVVLPIPVGFIIFSENISIFAILAIGIIVVGVVLLSKKRHGDGCRSS